MNTKNLIFIIIPFLFTACATNKIIQGPDGTPHQLIKCRIIESCYEDATKVCGGPYKIVNTSNDTSGSTDSSGSFSSHTTHELLVKCGK